MVYIVCGPPGSGKTTWALERMRFGDAIVDQDALYTAVSGLAVYQKPLGLWPLVEALREAALAWLAAGGADVGNVYVIAGAPRRRDRELLRERFGGGDDVEVVVLAVEPGECMRRIAGDGRRGSEAALWARPVLRWWEEYEGG